MFQWWLCPQRIYLPELECNRNFLIIPLFFHFLSTRRKKMLSISNIFPCRCLEEGAEEFLLKPLQLSDVEKLQTHLLKSLDKYSSKRIDDNSFNTDSSNITVSNKSNSNNIVSKRKALSPEIEDRRPKMKGLAVV